MSVKSKTETVPSKKASSKRALPSPQSPHKASRAKSEGRERRGPAKIATTANRAANPSSKLVRISELLKRPSGATLDALTKETGWQAHSVRAAITGLRKKGLAVTLTKHESGPSTYHAATKR